MSLVTSRYIYTILRADYECRLIPLQQYLRTRTERVVFERLAQYESQKVNAAAGITADAAALMSLNSPNMKWLSNVTLEELVRMRNDGFMEEMRSLFRLSSAEIRRASATDVRDVSLKVAATLDERLAEHSEILARSKTDYRRRFMLSAASLFLNGSISLVAALVPLLPVTIAAAVYSIGWGGKSALDMVRDKRQHDAEWQQLHRRPIALVFDVYKRTDAQRQR